MLSLEEENALLRQNIEVLRKENRHTLEKISVYFNNSDLAFVVLDASQKVVEVNKTFIEIFGYSHQEMEGKHFSALFTTPQLYTTWCSNYVHFNALESVSNLE